MISASTSQAPRRALDKAAILRRHPLFMELAPPIVERLCSYATTRKVGRNATIFSKGDPGTGLMAIIAGSVKISVPSADGREAVLNLINEGEIFGEIALLDGCPRTADAIAVTDCELMVIDRREFIPFVRAEPEVALNLIEVLCRRLRHTTEQVEDVMFLDLPSRLAKALLALPARIEPGSAQRKLTITQRELGTIIGVSRESTNKQLQTWAERKWVKLTRGGIVVLAPNALAAIASAGADGAD